MATTSHSPIRLALCVTDLDVGGAEQQLVELAAGLDPGRFATTVYCLAPPPPDNRARLVRRLAAARIETHFLNARRLYQFPQVLWRLIRLFRAQRPDVVQSFLAHANILASLAAAATGTRARVTGIRVAERRRNWHLLAARLTNGLVDRHVCVSASVAEFASDVGKLPRGKLMVIPQGIDVPRFASAAPHSLEALGLAKDRKILTYIGRLDKQKAVDWLLGVMPDVLGRLPGHDLLIVGDGPQRGGLEALSRKLGLVSRVHFAGWRPDVPEILAAANLVLFHSSWEGMPNALLEAMAAGKPVITTDVEGAVELLGPSVEQIIPRAQPQLFADTVVALASDAARAAEIGRQNQRRAGECFSVQAMVAAYSHLYESLLGAPGNSGPKRIFRWS